MGQREAVAKGGLWKTGSVRMIHKALGVSILIHLVIIISLMVFPLISAREQYTPLFQVSLVTQPEPQQKTPTVQPPKKKPAPKEPAQHEKKAAPPRKKPKKAVERKRESKKEPSLKRVQRSIDEIKRRVTARQNLEAQEQRISRVSETKRNAYFEAVAARIRANWSLLKNQMEDLGTLTTDLGLQIHRNGAITKIVIEKPSGNALFDEFAVRAVKKSTPLPPFPEELREDRLEVTIGLSS